MLELLFICEEININYIRRITRMRDMNQNVYVKYINYNIYDVYIKDYSWI